MWQACPFPSAVALLLHRIKADLVAEKRRGHLDLAATSDPARRGSSAPAFAPAQTAAIPRIVQVVEEVLGSQARYLTFKYQTLPNLPPPSLLPLPTTPTTRLSWATPFTPTTLLTAASHWTAATPFAAVRTPTHFPRRR